MSFFTSRFADRIGGVGFGQSTEIFKFEEIKRAKREARAANPLLPLIDFGVGESDREAFPQAIDVLARESRLRENRGYADNGIPEFRESAARYLSRVYSVTDLDPHKEVLHCIGSKSAFALLPLVFINPGDVSLVTVPGYPILANHTRYLGGEAYPLPLLPSRNFLPDLASIPDTVLERAKLLYLNYPNNPTGALATREFFAEVVAFAKKHDIVVIHDAAYGELVYGGNAPLSFLSVPGAKDVGLEVHSLSKAFNMTGWRLGFIAGNAEAVSAFGAVKDNTDSGQFRAIQKAGEAVLETEGLSGQNRVRFSRRLDLLVTALRKAGFEVQKSGGTFYLYVKAPVGTSSGIRFANARECASYLIREKLISTVPWSEAGEYLRFSVTFEILPGGREGESEEDGERRTVEEACARLMSAGVIFDHCSQSC